MDKKMSILSVCGGNGVILFPFRRHLIANIEPRTAFKTPDNVQWKLNFDKIPLYKDLSRFYTDFDPLPELDLIIGAPDCGHSSILGLSRNKVYSDPRDNESLNMFFKAVTDLQPKVFVMENLNKFLETVTKSDLRERFSEYKLIFHNMSVSAFGNSQINRVRLLVIGVRRDTGLNPSVFRDIIQMGELKYCDELLKGLVYGEKCHIREDISTPITLYAGFKTTAEEIRKRWGDTNWTRWKVEGRNFTTAPGVYRNLADHYPNTARKANRQYNSEGLMMSPRELARIMGIPDEFEIWQANSSLAINKGRLTATKGAVYEVGLWVLGCMKVLLGT